MTYQPDNFTFEKSAFEISRVQTEQELSASNKVVANAINVNAASVNRAFGPMILDAPGVDLFIAKQADEIVSTVQTTRAGSTVGIWAMATSPNHQRKTQQKPS